MIMMSYIHRSVSVHDVVQVVDRAADPSGSAAPAQGGILVYLFKVLDGFHDIPLWKITGFQGMAFENTERFFGLGAVYEPEIPESLETEQPVEHVPAQPYEIEHSVFQRTDDQVGSVPEVIDRALDVIHGK